MSNSNRTTIALTIRGTEIAARYKDEGNRDRKKPQYKPLAISSDLLEIKLLDLYGRLIEKNLITSRDDFQLIGRLLNKILFTDDVQDLFSTARQLVKSTARNRIRFELEFMGDTFGLSQLPWEYLCYQNGSEWQFVSTVTELVLTRYLPPPDNSNELLVDLDQNKINILVAVLNPEPGQDGLGDLSGVEEEVSKQLEKFKHSLAKHKIEVNISSIPKPVTWNQFTEEIKKKDCKPHILHLIAHGTLGKDSNGRTAGMIAFHGLAKPEDIEVGLQEGNVHYILDEDFANAFEAVEKLPRFVFLHMCEGGAIHIQESSAGVALRLAQKGVQGVVAMQHPIEIFTSMIFSQVFYEALAEGWTVDEAVQMGRYKIKEKDSHNRAFGTPVLYLSTESESVLPKIPKSYEESGVLSKEEQNLIIGVEIFDKHLKLVFFEFRNSKKLEPDDMKKLMELCKGLFTCDKAKWLSELEKYYQGLDAFNAVEEQLGNLCVELMKRVRAIEHREVSS